MRFYNPDWGEGNFFHPDERNIGTAVSQIDPETGDYNPDFFAYGSVPIYMLYVISEGNFDTTIIAGRYLSAAFSTASLVLIYLLSNSLLNAIFHKKDTLLLETKQIDKYALLITAICAFSPGLIQFAHFMTFESFLTFEYLLFAYFAIKLLANPSWKIYLILSLITGIAVGTKVVSLFLLPVFVLTHLVTVLNTKQRSANKLKFYSHFPFKFLSLKFIVNFLLIGVFFLITNPFMILDYEAFRGSLDYESSVATGSSIVFYTQQFIDTIPFLYQFIYVFPSLISWPITIIGFFSLAYLVIYCIKFGLIFLIKNKYSIKLSLIISTLTGLGYGVFHFTMFVKWSRYMVPLLPFLIISTVLVLANFCHKGHKLSRLFFGILLFSTSAFAIIQGLNFSTIYLKPDPRVEAADWLKEQSDEDDTFAGEVYDMGMTAFNKTLGSHRITEFNYYNLDDITDDDQELDELTKLLNESEYIIIPSERIYPTRSRLPKEYPNSYEHYRKLFNGELGFQKVAEFTRTTYLEDVLGIRLYSAGIFLPLNYDETFRVFDQPTVTIFRKT